MHTLTGDLPLEQLNPSGMDDQPANESTGFEAQFTALQLALDAPVRRFVRRMLSSRPDIVDDVMQEMYIALYERLQSNPDALQPGAIRPYAFGIARNLCYEEMRRQKRRGSDDDYALGDEPQFDEYSSVRNAILADDSATPDDATHWLLLNVEVQAAIDRLPDMQRQVLILYCEQEMSYAEIAEIMGVNIGTVKSRLFYAKRALRGLLSPATLQALDESLSEPV